MFRQTITKVKFLSTLLTLIFNSYFVKIHKNNQLNLAGGGTLDTFLFVIPGIEKPNTPEIYFYFIIIHDYSYCGMRSRKIFAVKIEQNLFLR